MAKLPDEKGLRYLNPTTCEPLEVGPPQRRSPAPLLLKLRQVLAVYGRPELAGLGHDVLLPPPSARPRGSSFSRYFISGIVPRLARW